MKKLLGILLAMALFCSCFGAFAEEATPSGLKSDLVVLFTSDVHCAIDSNFGYAGLALVRDAYAARGNHVLLVDNGDSIQGEPVGTVTRGEANILLMNAVGYDIATIGNHEFDYTMDRFFELVEMADFPYISANFNKDGELVFAPYVIKEFDGVKFAFVGVTTPKTLTSSTPKYFQDENGNFVYGFFQGETGDAFFAAVQTAVDNARAEGANYVVALAHLGNQAEAAPYTYADLLSNTAGIDVLLDGHSHDTYYVEMLNKNGEPVQRIACGTKLEGIGYAKFAVDGTISTGLHTWSDSMSAAALFGLDTEITKAVADATETLNAALAEVVAHTGYDLVIRDPATDERIVRNNETNLGDLCADAYRIVSGADIAFVNGGGVRTNIAAGDITRNAILKVHPFGNSMCVVEATGQEILDALEYGVYVFPGEFGGFLQVSGITFEVHTDVPSPVVRDENGMFTGVEGECRVQNVAVGGEALDPEKTYTLACHDYLLKSMGDGYTMFADNVLLQDCVMLDNQVLATYITEYLGGDIPTEYADPYGQGRITFVTAE
ncbi:MAG: bifunctional metallophosphatase/5'-nucleotidase [Christensenellales bacterium]|jgi:2',3'-cyclic-nucleotide 2'-phosphodiesterase (5'-nucleotidase family)